MIKTFIIARNTASKEELRQALSHHELSPSFSSYSNGFRQAVASHKPEVLILEIGEQAPGPETWELVRKMKTEARLPAIALVRRDRLEGFFPGPEIDDILVSPFDAGELVLRINRLLSREKGTSEPIKGHGLVIDTDSCEVTVDGSKVDLTFKEYELLKLLASHKGHVFTREALLDKIWGYDYYGGDRTVDVHIRRLRSKIETDNTYIETVRNIGYRFVKDS